MTKALRVAKHRAVANVKRQNADLARHITDSLAGRGHRTHIVPMLPEDIALIRSRPANWGSPFSLHWNGMPCRTSEDGKVHHIAVPCCAAPRRWMNHCHLHRSSLISDAGRLVAGRPRNMQTY